MKYFIFSLTAFLVTLQAADLPIQQTTTGSYELVVSESPERREVQRYQLVFRDRASKKILGSADTSGGYSSPSSAAEMTQVVWHPSGEFVAFTDRATKHAALLYVYSLRNGIPAKLEFGDYVMNALGRVGATEVDLRSFSKPVSWEDDKLVVQLNFDVTKPGTGRLFYESTVTFHLDHGNFTAPTLRLLSVSAPKNLDE